MTNSSARVSPALFGWGRPRGRRWVLPLLQPRLLHGPLRTVLHLTPPPCPRLFAHLVSPEEQQRRACQAKSFRRLQVDHQRVLVQPLDGRVGGLSPVQDFEHTSRQALAQLPGDIHPKGQHAPRLGKVPLVRHGREPGPERQDLLLPVGGKEGRMRGIRRYELGGRMPSARRIALVMANRAPNCSRLVMSIFSAKTYVFSSRSTHPTHQPIPGVKRTP
jgi:hypothetical protein